MISSRRRMLATVLLPITTGPVLALTLWGSYVLCDTSGDGLPRARTRKTTYSPPHTVVREYFSEDVEAQIGGGKKEIWREAQIRFSVPKRMLLMPSALENGFGQPCRFVITGLRGGERSRVRVSQRSALSWSRGDAVEFFRRTRELARIAIPNGVFLKLVVEFGCKSEKGGDDVLTYFVLDILVTGL